ncbi:MAG: hypothetical protein HKN19_20035 [Halioglobus sp.]|nr:hypothetical protein [Halioglobus sp.]
MSVNFVIVGAPRTGSTLLVRTLNSIEGVRCHGELLQRNVVRGLEDGFDPEQATAEQRKARAERLYAEREADPVGFIFDALADDGLATGLKITYEIFFDPRWQVVVEQLVNSPDMRFVHLLRHNELRRYVSEEILYAGGPNHSAAGGRAEQSVQIAVDIDAFLARQQEVVATAQQLRTLVAERETLEVSYEAMARDIGAEVSAICAFLDPGIDTSGTRAALSKVGAKDLRATVSNVDELLAHPATRGFVEEE